ncbi:MULTISPECIES: hypothetical protein [unclassified Leucobacter]|uniref:hypothetical protein n=1 Tax=unclassified Leucobacter TaxID=2621730 RepID=UPI0006220A1C|nr:hypothetical protein [Leucobacter sp. Ag1]KKI18708.1 hypothetical protein XM48_10520 [Leucobacter sp. Ag1]
MYGDWILTYPGTAYRFGPPQWPVQFVGVEVSTDSYRVDDTAVPRGDGQLFGQDFVEPGEIKISVKIDFTTAPYPVEECARLAWEARTELARVWRADAVRQTPGLLAELTMGGVQMVEGRPRRAKFDDDHQGVGLIFAELYFVPADPTAYTVDADGNSTWHEQTVDLVPPISGGLVAPLVAPLSTMYDSDRSRPFVVGGTAPAWPIIRVKGPINAGAQVDLVSRWTVRLTRALAYDETAEIDCRPGRQASRLNGQGRNVLAPDTDFSRLSMTPGPQELTLRGTSMEGTASVTVRWRETRGAI